MDKRDLPEGMVEAVGEVLEPIFRWAYNHMAGTNADRLAWRSLIDGAPMRVANSLLNAGLVVTREGLEFQSAVSAENDRHTGQSRVRVQVSFPKGVVGGSIEFSDYYLRDGEYRVEIVRRLARRAMGEFEEDLAVRIADALDKSKTIERLARESSHA